MLSTGLVPLAVGSGVVVIVVAICVVLVVLLVTMSMRGRQRRRAQRRGETRRNLDQAQERAVRAEQGRDIAREGGEDLDPDR
ncbi:MAG TPA: hypothetical protein VKG82_08815 [Solirubrobacteraceae bacterium]|nr:hypothetical protein [Solirubrobacteraceae bacterium]HME03967.1 hypothetical protein [Solirubrobacteraceae bacterium]